MAEENTRCESEPVINESPTAPDDDIQAKIESAMSARVDYFKAQADSLTFGGVRRLLEEDLGLEKCALDGQKIFIKQRLLECINGPADDSNKSGEAGEEYTSLKKNRGSTESHQVTTSKEHAKDSSANDKMEDSPVMGLLAAQKAVESQAGSAEGNDSEEDLSESRIKKAMRKRASYIKANLEKLSTAEVRRLLEGDLGVKKFALDPFKNFILQEIDELVNASSESAKKTKKKRLNKLPQRKTPKKVSTDESADSPDSESEAAEEEEEPKKKRIVRGKSQNSEGPRKRKNLADKPKVSGKKRKLTLNDNSDAEGDALSEDGNSQSSDEKPVKKREVSTPTYGKRVEHLKSIIKSCGMSVPPIVYKKVKQEPENKRETCLIKELEGILSKEGLSPNPSEKEIKEVKRRKERAKELEGIDMSNIVTSSRRRSTSSFLSPPKPKQPVESEKEDADDTDEAGDDDDNEDDEEVDEEDEEEDGGDDDGNQSEESNEDKDSD